MSEKLHVCRLPLFRVPFGKVVACPKCGAQWIGDVVVDEMMGEEIADWTRI